ncbi:unnamed protein product, partial [Meganyctiphanes norvegica]
MNKVKVRHNNEKGTKPEEVTYLHDDFLNPLFGKVEVMIKEEIKCNEERMQLIQCDEIKCKDKLERKEGPIDLTRKNYQCSRCDKAFPQNSTPIRHQKPLSVEKQHQCSHCENAFSTNSYLIKHHRTHAEEKPYKCGKCEKTFSTN